jgi:hypothetical protein
MNIIPTAMSMKEEGEFWEKYFSSYIFVLFIREGETIEGLLEKPSSYT